jgi:hypothetical protein
MSNTFEKFKSLCAHNEAVYFKTVLMQKTAPEGAEEKCLAFPYRGPKGRSCNILTCPRIMNAQGAPGLKNAGEVRV